MGFPDASTARDRLLGYKTALKKAGMVVEEDMIVGSTYDALRAGPDIERLIENPCRPTSIFAANDLLAASVLRECKKHDIRVPEDMEVVGYANHTSSEYLDISTVSQQPAEMGREAARRLFQRIKDPSIRPEVIRVPVSLITRGSTRS
jgi:LacI family transcriptional regulator